MCCAGPLHCIAVPAPPLTQMVIGLSSDGVKGPLADMPLVDPFKAQEGVTVDISPVPYDASSDAANSDKNKKIFEEDDAWERKRGTAEWETWNNQQRALLEMDTGSDSGSSNNSNGSGSSISSGSPRSNASSSSSSVLGDDSGSGFYIGRKLKALQAAL